MQENVTFTSDEEAKTYACENLRKNDSLVAYVSGTPAFISSTCLPLERRLREPIETAVADFLEELGIAEEDREQISVDIGADISSSLIREIEKQANVKILCSYLSY